jgi:hypothetical protein
LSVRPVAFGADGSVDVVFDELGHSGTIPAAQVAWAIRAEDGGGPIHTLIVLNCPDGCGSTSSHPVGGGAAPAEVQQMFVHKTEREGCACGNVAAATTAVPESHVRLNCSRMDGPERWQASVAPQAEPRAEAAPPQTPIVYRQSDRLVIGEHPRGGVGPEHGVAVIVTAEYEILLRTDPAYLSADGQHILSTPPVGASV